MAYKGKVISNNITKQSIEFLTTSKDSNGQMLEMISTYQPHSIEPAPHYHPKQHEYFTVVQGELYIRMGKEIYVLKQGYSINIPENTPHSMWNNSDHKTVVHWKVIPASDTEYFLETMMALVNDGKTNERGMPGILQVALTAKHFENVFRLMKPPYLLQRFIFTFLKPFALLAGKKAAYKEYLD